MMDTNKKNREYISALADGEVAPADLELAMAALLAQEGQAAWEAYHRIGDALRGQASTDLSAGFAERLAGRPASVRRTPSQPRRRSWSQGSLDAPAAA
jgi:sigma-E factor negative regulatory protein RseA